MNTTELLPHITLEPSLTASYSTLWLHGLGADGHDFTPIVPDLNPVITEKMRFIFPHAPIIPVTVNGGYAMRAWFDIYDMSINRQIDLKGIDDSVKRIRFLIERELEKGIPADHIFLAGFSQGAVMAMITGLGYPERLAGIIALSGYLPYDAERITELCTPANKHLPIFLAHGQQDPIVPYPLGLNTKASLEQADLPVTWHAYPMPHSVCHEEIQDLSKWMTAIIGEEN